VVIVNVKVRVKLLDAVTGFDTACVFKHNLKIASGAVSRASEGRYLVTRIILGEKFAQWDVASALNIRSSQWG